MCLLVGLCSIDETHTSTPKSTQKHSQYSGVILPHKHIHHTSTSHLPLAPKGDQHTSLPTTCRSSYQNTYTGPHVSQKGGTKILYGVLPFVHRLDLSSSIWLAE